MSTEHSTFATEFFSCGHDTGTCLYGWLCPPCAVASARSKLDDSSCCFNMLCVGAAPSRWMIRTAYGIEGSAWEDVFSTACCLPCAASQMLHTVNEYPKIPYTETRDMSRMWEVPVGQCDCGSCMYAFCCSQCAVASAASTGTGMPWCFAFCCMNMCSARNMIRRHYRIRGADMVEECLTPSCVYCFGSCTIFCLIGLCFTPCTVAGCTAFLAQMVEQSKATPMPEPGTGYLSNYKPQYQGGDGSAPVTMQPQVQPGMPVVAAVQMTPQQGYTPVSTHGASSGGESQPQVGQAIVMSPSAPGDALPPPPYAEKTQI